MIRKLTLPAIYFLVGVALLFFLGQEFLQNPAEEELTKIQEYTPQEILAMEIAAKKKRREQGYSRMDNPNLFYDYHEAIRTPEGESRMGYPANYRMKELKKAWSLKPNARVMMLDWKSRGPNNVPGRTRSILPLPSDPLNTWLVGAVGGGIWKSTDGGQSWSNKSDNFPTLAISALATSESDASIIYAGTGELVGGSRPIVGDGIFKSEDEGETWTQLTSTAGSTDFRSVTRIIVDPQNPDIVLASTAENFWDSESQSQIMRSIDGGQSWSKVYESSQPVEQVIYTPGNFNIQYGAVNGRGVIKSTDAGLTWSNSNNGMLLGGRVEIAISPVKPDRLYASAVGSQSGSGSDLYMSDDGGSNWLLSVDPANNFDFLGGQGYYDNTIMADPYDADIVYYGGVNLFRSVITSNPENSLRIENVEVTENGLSFWDVIDFNALYYDGSLDIGDSPVEDFVDVEIRFGSGISQKAHRFTVPVGSTSGVSAGDYSYQDYIEVPFEVWDVENNRQLMVSFRDQGRDGVFNLIESNTSGPATEHSREYIFIHSLDYDPDNPSPQVTLNGGHEVNDLYFVWPALASGSLWDPADLPSSNLSIDVSTVVAPTFEVVSNVVSDAYGQFGGPNRFPQNDGRNPC